MTYRIFYVDKDNKYGDGKNTVYLKADYTEGKALSTDISKSTNSDLILYKRMNPIWSAKRGGIDATSWNNNEKAAALLCAPSQWTAYVDEDKASYAIGGPSVEMYIDSYNQVPHTEAGNYTLRAIYSETDSPGYIYTIDGTIQNNGWTTNLETVDNIGYNSMYAQSEKYWWLTSPSSYNFNGICYVYPSSLNYDGYNFIRPVEPIVCLKPAIRIEIEE